MDINNSGTSPATKKIKRMKVVGGISEEDLQTRLDRIRSLVAKPIPREPSWNDPQPALIEEGCVLIGNKYHASNVDNLKKLGVTAVLNCASGGISRLPVDELQECGIRYAFTNVRQDNHTYPILHDPDGECSKHLQTARSLYADVKKEGGKVLFFCIAGQNRSAALAVAVLMLFGHSMDPILESLSKSRAFVLENVGFQQQLVELEAILRRTPKMRLGDTMDYIYVYAIHKPILHKRTSTEIRFDATLVEVELLIPGLCTMEIKIPLEATIATVKHCLVEHANKYLFSEEQVVGKSWVVLAMFGYDDMYDFPLEVEAIELSVQLDLMKKMFHLEVIPGTEGLVRWNSKCRFALVIFSVKKNPTKDPSNNNNDNTIVAAAAAVEEPWTFVHEERPEAPATLLKNNLMSTNLRAWDFVSGQSYCSKQPIVFSFAKDPRDKRQFMRISTNANEPVQFGEPGEGGILGMGANAIVHRVQLMPVSENKEFMERTIEELPDDDEEGWDAAVKRPFGLVRMLASLENRSEAGLAKRMRSANSLNSDGRVLFFYGLGVVLSANASNHQEFKFELTLLARYEEEFSTYTMRRFMEDYIAVPAAPPTNTTARGDCGNRQLQADFSIISIKLLLVGLLNAFRDLTLMGVQAFDFNVNNVLVSRDHRTVRLIDIDGNSKGSIQFPSEYIQGAPTKDNNIAHYKPSLDVDLNSVLPTIVQQLILGKGRGKAFVTNKVSEIWRAGNPRDAKEIIKEVIRENFYSSKNDDGDNNNNNNMVIDGEDGCVNQAEKHTRKVAEWLYALLKKESPWGNWTNDIYDAMRCIDHLPIS